MELRNLRPLGLAVITLVAINSLFLPLILLLQDFAANVSEDTLGAVISVMYLFKAATVGTFAVWIYLAGKNLITAGYQDLEFSPGSRIWWFAVPIAALFKPYQGMRELWNASHANDDYGDNNGLLGTWWALWLGTGVLSLISGFLVGTGSMAASISVLLICAANLGAAFSAALIVRGISDAQSRLTGAAVAEVFA